MKILADLGGAPAERGVVYLVGSGPGDTGLVTLRAAHLVATGDVIVYDALASAPLMALMREKAERIDVGKRGGGRKKAEQEGIEEILIAQARAGKSVVRLKGGDPFVFGRGGEEAIALAKEKIPYEIVPGISSSIAAPAYAGIPVTHRGVAAAVTIATGHEDYGKKAGDLDLDAIARANGTIVLLMSHSRMRDNFARLITAGKPSRTPAAAIEWGTTPRQRVVRATLATIADEIDRAGLSAPIVFVIGDVVEAIGHDWLRARRPLLGRRILVTRSRAEASQLSRRLAALGADVIETPAIRLVTLDPAPLDAALTGPARYSGLLLTSPRAVEILADRVFAVGKDARLFAGIRIFAIGPSTEEALRNRLGLRADFVPARFVAEELLAKILESYGGKVEGKRFLLPRAEEAREILAEGLREKGATVEMIPVYRTEADPETPARLAALLAEKPPDLVTFTSSSTVKLLLSGLAAPSREVLIKVPAVAIGPVTAKTARAAGFQVTEADESTIEGLVRKVREVMKEKTF